MNKINSLPELLNNEVRYVTAELMFIKNIKTGDVLNTNPKSLMKSGWYASMYRTFTQTESRAAAYDYFCSIYDKAFDLVEMLISHQNPKDYYIINCKNILLHIEESLIGLLNHTHTYINDRDHVSKINALIESINARYEASKKLINTDDDSNNNNYRR